ncbi:phosphoribosylanthranilate isomerase [Nocardia salmonicida]|uniref:phosphoribosylanthranilate isomerase n=1 Tax=Nocardia salmonicida TaxID=53431 RepID=UPI003664774B
MEKRVQVKICGIRSELDLAAALSARPDAVGFISGITHFSEDALTPEKAAALSAQVSSRVGARSVKRMLVTHLEDADAILQLAQMIDVEAIQVHGLVSRANLRKVYEHRGNREILRAVHVTDEGVFSVVEDVAKYCDVVLLDSRTPSRLGGTGQTHDWNISKKIVEAMAGRKDVALAGGLTPDNVGQAIDLVQPYGVDVNTGVDDAGGNKSKAACAEFVKAATRELASTCHPAQQH